MSNPFLIEIPHYCLKADPIDTVAALKIERAILSPRGFELHFEDTRFVPMLATSLMHPFSPPPCSGDWAVFYLHSSGGYLARGAWFEQNWQPVADS